MSSKTEFWKTLRWALALAVFALLAFTGLRFLDQQVSQTTAGLDQVLSVLTQSDTRIVEGRAEITRQTEISELALLEIRMSATRRFENDRYILKYLPTGTKQLIVQGHYRVTAGYRLEPGVSLHVVDNVPVARFPDPQILGVELIDFEILSEKDGWANDITASDRAVLLRELREQMRREAEKSGILDMVESTLSTRLRDLLRSPGVRIERAPTDKN